MTHHALALALLPIITGCSAYIHTFTAPIDYSLVAVRTELSQRGTSVTVRVIDRESQAYGVCRNDAAGFSCEFPLDYLLDSIDVVHRGGWQFLGQDDAEFLCRRAMFSVYGAAEDEEQACGWALMSIRLREMLPAPEDKNQ